MGGGGGGGGFSSFGPVREKRNLAKLSRKLYLELTNNETIIGHDSEGFHSFDDCGRKIYFGQSLNKVKLPNPNNMAYKKFEYENGIVYATFYSWPRRAPNAGGAGGGGGCRF